MEFVCLYVEARQQQLVFEYCPENRYKRTSLGESMASIVWKDPVAFDNSGNNLTVTCNPQMGIFPIGRTEVLCQAVVDDNDSTAECTFYVTVFGKNNTKSIMSIPPYSRKKVRTSV